MKLRHLPLLLTLFSNLALADPAATRQPVPMPSAAQEALREEMLMKLQAVYSAEAAIAAGKPADAAEQVERYLGISAMGLHRKLLPEARPGMHMPDAMHALGRQSHQNGSELAAALKAGDRPRIDAALRDLLGTCVACHSTYRLPAH